MHIQPLALLGAFLITLEKRTDERGFFARTFCADTFKKHGLYTQFVQDSLSYNAKKSTVRGLHYQEPASEIKLVQCVQGSIYDVIVDLRKDSPTYGQWTSILLNEENLSVLYIPAGCAHGFQTLSDNTLIAYKISELYVPEYAQGIKWNDPSLGITWPLPITSISNRDAAFKNYSF